jgi:apolipoprotein D and lipocalin family protein
MRVSLNPLVLLLLSGCLGMPAGVRPVEGFDPNRYMGKWYEIARLDHSFERGLERITAEYSLSEDGSVTVLNRGYSTRKDRWKEAKGRAVFVRGPDEGYLKVSFFWPFYGSYVVFGLDKENYQYAYVASYNTTYLWLLARSPTVGDDVIDRFIERSKALGFDTDRLIFVNHP